MSEANPTLPARSIGISPGGLLMTLSAVVAVIAAYLPATVLHAFGTSASLPVKHFPGGTGVLLGGIAALATGASALRRLNQPLTVGQLLAFLVTGSSLGLLIILSAREVLNQVEPDIEPVTEVGIGIPIARVTGWVIIAGSLIRAYEIRRQMITQPDGKGVTGS